MSDHVEEKTVLDEKKSADALSSFQTQGQSTETLDATALMEISQEDVKKIMEQLEMTKADAEKGLRNNEGDLQKALRALIRS